MDWNSLFVFFLALIFCSKAKKLERRVDQWGIPAPAPRGPFIGILAQETYHSHPEKPNHYYITRSYVKFIQGAGGVVLPILTNSTSAQLRSIFSSINGLLLPGGSTPLITSPYYKTAKELFEMAMHANDLGDYFPIWGTCLGLQALHAIRVDSDSIISSTDARDSSWPLHFTQDARHSKLLINAPDSIYLSLQNEAITYNNHKNCVRSMEYQKHSNLSNFFKIISTNTDRQGMDFISTAEAIKYPFYLVQWHPEKSLYVTSSPKISHSPSAMAASQYMANFFISEARKNKHVSQYMPIASMMEYSKCPHDGAWSERYDDCYDV